MSKREIIILGAGLAGLSAAWHLQKRGIDCRVLEKDPEVGGLCRSKQIDGFTVDYDGHLLHFKHQYAFDLASKLLQDNLVEHKRSSWIYSHGRYTRYPFQANLYGLPSAIVKECLLGFIEAAKAQNPCPPRTFLDWINRTFGRGIARHFMVPYNAKFWTLHPEKMSCAWLDGFIPVPSLDQLIEGTIRENKRTLGYNAHFWYPKKGGINQLALAFARGIKNIQTNCRVAGIDTAAKRIKTSRGETLEYDHLISTIPLPEFPCLAGGVPSPAASLFKRLRWNSVFNLNLGIDKNDDSGRHWVYFPEKELSFFRAGFFHNFSASLAPAGKSSLYTEVSYSRDYPLDKTAITGRIIRDLKKTGIVAKNDKIIFKDINDIKYGYPICDSRYLQVRDAITDFLKRDRIIPVGRYGSWRYMSMEEVIMDGKAAADKIA